METLYLSTAAAQDRPRTFPSLFDAREPLTKPDLVSLVRLRFLTTSDFPPFNFLDQTGRLSGFHIDLARAICTELKIEAKCEIQSLPFNALEKALETRQGDVVLAGVSVTDTLRQKFDFSRPFLRLPARLVRNLKFTPDKENIAKAKTGVVKATAHEAMFRAFFPDARPVVFDDSPTLLAALKNGEIDMAFGDGLQLSFWLSSTGSHQCCAFVEGAYFSEKFLGEGMTAMLRSQDETLTQALNYALATLSRNGKLTELYRRHFPNGLY